MYNEALEKRERMHTRVVLGDNIWFVVEESLDEVLNKYNDNTPAFKARVIDGYDVAIAKEKILCLVSIDAQQLQEDNS